AAVNYGLSACWIGHLDIEKASKILNLPDDMACHFLMPLGYPAEEPGSLARKPFSEIVFCEQW
ncbi:MAG: nitroreductase family protein, partial [Halanaerobium sp.]|nr:nitroreductase family protein [Halanaerobium sp.]